MIKKRTYVHIQHMGRAVIKLISLVRREKSYIYALLETLFLNYA